MPHGCRAGGLSIMSGYFSLRPMRSMCFHHSSASSVIKLIMKFAECCST